MDHTVNIHAAKTQLSRLVDQAAKGQSFIIAKAGKPMVRVVPLNPVDARRALGSLTETCVFPVDVKAAFVDDIEAMFNGAPINANTKVAKKRR